MILLVDQVESDELRWNVLDKSCRKEEQRCHPVQKCKQQIAPADFALCLLSAHPFGSAATRWYTAKIYQWQHDGKPVANLHSRADKPINRFLWYSTPGFTGSRKPPGVPQAPGGLTTQQALCTSPLHTRSVASNTQPADRRAAFLGDQGLIWIVLRSALAETTGCYRFHLPNTGVCVYIYTYIYIHIYIHIYI